MNIIHLVLGKANPERMNGVNKVVHEMATMQKEAGYNVQVWGISSDITHNYPARIFKTKLFKKETNPFRLPATLREAFSKLPRNSVIHMHGAFIPVFYTAAKELKQIGVPFVLTPHSSYNVVMMKKNAWIKKLYVQLFESSLLSNAGRIHLVGKSEFEGLNKIFATNKALLIPYGFQRQKIMSSSVPTDLFTIGYCGRLDIFSKGLDTLLNGFAKFYATHKNAQLIIIGDGNQRKSLQQLTKDLEIEQSVQWTGALFSNEKIAMLKNCHVFAHPSRTDGLPATIVEAASIGLPCIVSEQTNMGDYINQYKAGYVISNSNVVEFTEALNVMYERIMIKKEMTTLSNNAIRMIDEAFNWKKLLIDFNDMYESASNKSLKKSISVH